MDGMADALGKLSTKAKEWNPRQSFQPSSSSASAAAGSNFMNSNDNNNSSSSKSVLSVSASSSSSVWGSSSSRSNSGIGGGTSNISSITSPWKPTMTKTNTSSFSANAANWNSNPTKIKEFIPQSTILQNQKQQQQQTPLPESNQSTIASSQNQPQREQPQPKPILETSVPRGSVPSTNTNTFTSNNPLTQPQHKNIHSFGLPNHTLWSLYRSIAMDSTKEMEPHDARYKAIPPSFTNAMPLQQTPQDDTENTFSQTLRSSFGYHNSIFKVTSQDDGKLYCLRRYDNVKGVNQKIAMTVTNAWSHSIVRDKTQSHSQLQGGVTPRSKFVLDHPGLARFYKCFYVLQNRAVFFVHRYYPMSMTLKECLYGLGRGMGGIMDQEVLNNQGFHPLDETTIWSYVTQLVSAIRAVHRGNLACRTLQMNHILVSPDAGSGVDENAQVQAHGGDINILRTNRVRLRINCVGVVDALEFEARRPIGELQIEDMRCLGRLIMSLATGTELQSDVTEETLSRCEGFLRQNYSQELHTLTMSLLAKSRPGRMGLMIVNPPTIDEVCRAVAEHAFDELDSANTTIDGMDDALGAEYESGRALRLLMKLAFINERPEFGVDPRWSESGDCYVLKLFRDFGKFNAILNVCLKMAAMLNLLRTVP